MRKEVIWKSFAVFHDSDLQFYSSMRAYSLYNGVLILWDEDFDTRVMEAIDGIPDYGREELLVVHEHEATISLVWDRFIPDGYEMGKDIEVDADTWNIGSSRALRGEESE